MPRQVSNILFAFFNCVSHALLSSLIMIRFSSGTSSSIPKSNQNSSTSRASFLNSFNSGVHSHLAVKETTCLMKKKDKDGGDVVTPTNHRAQTYPRKSVLIQSYSHTSSTTIRTQSCEKLAFGQAFRFQISSTKLQ